MYTLGNQYTAGLSNLRRQGDHVEHVMTPDYPNKTPNACKDFLLLLMSTGIYALSC